MFDFNKEPYIDMHTHHARIAEDLVSIYHIPDHFLSPLPQQKQLYFSMGIHPWFIKKDGWQQDLKSIGQAAGQEKVLAIGECGLDKVCDTDRGLQAEVFTAQIQLAEQIKKPLIIHCVKAYSEVLQLLRDNSFSQSVIFHGFNKKWNLAKQILDKGYCLSYGPSMLHADKTEVLAKTPLSQLFLESDDNDMDIREMYKTVSAIRKESVGSLKEAIQKNFDRLFNKNRHTT